jgi:hypothetical protein
VIIAVFLKTDNKQNKMSMYVSYVASKKVPRGAV